MRPIVEMDDSNYLVRRAQELLGESWMAEDRYGTVKKAISLLALFVVKHSLDGNLPVPGTRKTSSGRKVPMQIGGG
jgi:hypothetical protein